MCIYVVAKLVLNVIILLVVKTYKLAINTKEKSGPTT